MVTVGELFIKKFLYINNLSLLVIAKGSEKNLCVFLVSVAVLSLVAMVTFGKNNNSHYSALVTGKFGTSV